MGELSLVFEHQKTMDMLFKIGLAATSPSTENLCILLQTRKRYTNISSVMTMIICLARFSVQPAEGNQVHTQKSLPEELASYEHVDKRIRMSELNSSFQ